MTMQEFLNKWGTRSASLMILEAAEYGANRQSLTTMLKELANELESALRDAHERLS